MTESTNSTLVDTASSSTEEFDWSITVGDPTGDDHGKSYTEYFRSNRSLKQVKDNYAMTTKMFAFNLLEECDDFDIYELTKEGHDALKVIFAEDKKMMVWLNNTRNLSYDDFFEMTPETYIKTYLKMAQRLDPEMTWTIVNGKNLFLGGHGLFTKD